MTEFYSNGDKKSISVYKNNELGWNKNWLENGHINGIRIEKGINNMLDKLTFRAFYSLISEWTPAQINKKNVRCFQIFPINFIYTENEYDYVEMRSSMLYLEIN